MSGFNDNTAQAWDSFYKRRTEDTWHRMEGMFRAVVVETNDPLNMYRIRFKVPELHNFDLKPEECPWASPAHAIGGRRAGEWTHPCIDDWVWIQFEKGHLYGPIWTGFCTPTRRKMYTYPQIHQTTPLSVNEEEETADTPDDYDEDYLPKDGRPMSFGRQDRYGNMDISRSIGFFPVEHETTPPDPDTDAVSKSNFEQKQSPPISNDPDVKYMARITKYGNVFLQGDQGYEWKEEFDGSFEDDEQFEIDRWKYLQKLLNEDEPNETDQRRMMMLTRYGHLFEMRDVGWDMSRPGEYGDPRNIGANPKGQDQRWCKFRSKDGHILQMLDMGSDPIEDNKIKRLLIDDSGVRSEKENEWWSSRDARQLRLLTRYGYKFVMDDRGSSATEADSKAIPTGNGILVKGRRAGSSQGVPIEGNQVGGDVSSPGDPDAGPSNKDDTPGEANQAGFYWEINENDDANWTTVGSPLGQAMMITDKLQHIMLATRIKDYARPFMGLEENEFQRNSLTSKGAEEKGYHLKLDLQNEYLRLKTRGGNGEKAFQPPGGTEVNKTDLKEGDLNQGLEARDGEKGDGAWVELVDAKHRGLWFSNKEKLVILRAQEDVDMSISMKDDKEDKKELLIRNDAGEKLQIRCMGDVEIKAEGNLLFQAEKKISFKAGTTICAEAGGTQFSIDGTGVGTNRDLFAQNCRAIVPGTFPGPGAGTASPKNCTVDSITKLELDKIEPEDRGKRYNDGFDTELSGDTIKNPD
jgi:hypothetical protein